MRYPRFSYNELVFEILPDNQFKIYRFFYDVKNMSVRAIDMCEAFDDSNNIMAIYGESDYNYFFKKIDIIRNFFLSFIFR